MSLAKTVPEGIRDKECERFALWERLPVPYVQEKDPVQETVASLKSDQSLKTTIRVDAELCLPIWHCGMHVAFLMQVSSTLDTNTKRGTTLSLWTKINHAASLLEKAGSTVVDHYKWDLPVAA